ncbi:MAG: hypothetical protein ACKVJV_10055 [Gammaproteobacteria bacterium]
MKKILIAISAATLLIVNVNANSHETTTVIKESRLLYHGGGCRKSSPAGQCCHKNHRTGYVHCH